MADREAEIRPLEEVLAAHPGWADMNAFERTKLCCAEMTRRGERLPSWSIIRDIIGKGSAGDINRGKEAFRREHAEDLRRLGRAIEGIPEELQAAFVEVWRLALATARDSLSAEATALRGRVNDAEERAKQAEEARLSAEERAEAAAAKAGTAEAALVESAKRLEALEEALARADQEVERLHALREADRVAFNAEIARQQEQLKAALERLEGAENFALRRIEEARAEAAARVAEELTAARERAAFLEARIRQLETLHEEAVSTITELRREMAARRREAETMLGLLGRRGRVPPKRWR